MIRIEKCFSNNPNKYYSKTINGKKETYFDPLHTCQWFIFLYFYANTMYKCNPTDPIKREVCDKIYGLSKLISSADLYYEVEMPEFFMCDHPMSSVIGRAKFGNGFNFLQGCTVGNNHGVYPVFGENVTMFSNSTVIGNSHIGSNVLLSAGSYVKDEDIPDNMVVFGRSPDLIIKPRRDLD